MGHFFWLLLLLDDIPSVIGVHLAGRRLLNEPTDFLSLLLLLPFNRLFFSVVCVTQPKKTLCIEMNNDSTTAQQHLPPPSPLKIFFVNKTKGFVRIAFKQTLLISLILFHRVHPSQKAAD